MSSSGFLHFLFGDDTVERRGKVLEDVAHSIAKPHQPSPCLNLCYGQENLDFLRSHGVESQLAHEDAVPDLFGLGDHPIREHGMIQHDYCVWAIKLDAIRKAFEVFDEVCFLDWDSHLMKPLPGEFWSRMRLSSPIQMPLVSYHVRWCYWRGRHNQRSLPEGAFIYCRDKTIIDRAWELFPDLPWRHHTDQTVLAWVMDEMDSTTEPDSWGITVDCYKDAGHEPYCVRIYNEFFTAEEEVFGVSRGPKHSRWLKKVEMRKSYGNRQ